jgi:hypothetical protein
MAAATVPRPMSGAPRPKVSHPAVTRLAEDAALAKRIAVDRPRLIIDALLGGATPQEIIAVLGWDLVDLEVAVNRWAPRLRGEGRLTGPACAAVLTMVVSAAR